MLAANGACYGRIWLKEPQTFQFQRARAHEREGTFYVLRGKRGIAKPGAKERAQRIIRRRLRKEPIYKIASDEKLDYATIYRLLHDRRITGKIIVNGEKVDSGFESLTDEATFEKVSMVSLWDPKKLKKIMKKRASDIKSTNLGNIMACLPAFHWEIVDITGLSWGLWQII